MSEAGVVEGRSDGHLIKVLEVLDGGEAFLGRTTNGSTARFSLGQVADIRRGCVVFVGEDRWEVVPESAWPEIPEVAIIRKILDDGLLIEYASTALGFGSCRVNLLSRSPSETRSSSARSMACSVFSNRVRFGTEMKA